MRQAKQKLWSSYGLAALAFVAACASTPPADEKQLNIYFDPQTGIYSLDETASEEDRKTVELMNHLLGRGASEGLSEDEIWQADADGNLTHIQSGMICPVYWSHLERGAVTTYQDDGLNVGCNYTSDQGSIVTFYAYHYPASVREELAEIMDKIIKPRHPVHNSANIRILEMPGIGAKSVSEAILFTSPQGMDTISGVTLADVSGWRFKVRFTYPLAEADETETFLGVSFLSQEQRIREAPVNQPAPSLSRTL